jgi:hypothetical protein
MEKLGVETFDLGELTYKLGKLTLKDAITMRIITVVTLIYLPATFVSVSKTRSRVPSINLIQFSRLFSVPT